MKLGYFTMPLHPPGSDPAKTIRDDLDQLVVLDELGFTEAWIGEHFTSAWENIPAPDLLIAQALPLTKNIKLCTGVNCMPNHNPVVLAHRIAQLDNMARGRFMWGVGSGGFPGDFELFDVDPRSGLQRTITHDAIEEIVSIWTDPTPGLYEAKTYRYRLPEPDPEIGLGVYMKPYQKPHPPIAVAGVSEKSETLVLAGERGWIPMSINIIPARILNTHWRSVEEGAKKAGKTVDRASWRIARDVYVADSTEQAQDDILNGVVGRDWTNYFLPLLKKLRFLSLTKVDPEMPDEDVNLEYLMENVWLVGSVEDVTNKIRKLYEETGGFGHLLAIGHEWEPRDKWTHSMELLANEVLPAVQDL